MELRSVLGIFTSVFAISTTFLNSLIIMAILGRRRAYYRSHFFYIIYMVGAIIDVITLINSHTLALFPSRGLFLDFFLASTTPGRVFLFFAWSSRTCQGFTNFYIALNRATAVVAPFSHKKIWSLSYIRAMCFLVQFGISIPVGVYAATGEVYWVQAASGSWYIQFFDIPSTQRFARFLFVLMCCFSPLTIAAYAVLLRNFRAHTTKSTGGSGLSDGDTEAKNEQPLVNLAICVCTLEIFYFFMYCYGFVMNANFELPLETVYVSYFVVTDLYSGVPTYLLLYFSTSIRQDVSRLICPLLN
ncbi:hypothetical protein PENTCL1PPCAC_16088, partial [Pristionchus entomophagus]